MESAVKIAKNRLSVLNLAKQLGRVIEACRGVFSTTRVRMQKYRKTLIHGFVESFNRALLDEFFRFVFRLNLYEGVESLRIDLDDWLHENNCEILHLHDTVAWEGELGKR